MNNIYNISQLNWRYHIFRRFGYSSHTEETSGKIVEFIGTSGVGKSTLFRKCEVKLRIRWFFPYYLDLLKQYSAPRKSDDILMQMLKNRIDEIYSLKTFVSWYSLMDLKLDVRVIYETMLVAQNTFPKGIMIEEGLFRHFPGEIMQLGDEFPTELWKNRAFVYLRARTPETALLRLKSRMMKMAGMNIQRARADEEILTRIAQDQERFQSIVEKASSLDCPVLVINAEDPLQASIKNVLDFERSVCLRNMIGE